jgi:hypothetical protein
MEKPGDLDPRTRGPDDTERGRTETSSGVGGRQPVRCGNDEGGRTVGGRRGRALDEKSIRSEQFEGAVDRRPNRLAELGREIVRCPCPVEQRQEPREERPDSTAFEDDGRPAVLQHEPVAVADEAIPRRK